MEDLPNRDALAAIVWGVVNLLLATAGWRVSHRLFPEDRFTARIIHTTVFSWATVVVTAVLLGLCHALTAASLLAGVAALALLALRCGTAIKSTETPNTADRAVLIGWLILLTLGLVHIVQVGVLAFPTDWDSLMYHIPLIDQWLQARSLYAPRDAVWYNPGNNELVGLWVAAPFSGDFLIGFINLPAAVLLSLGSIELARQIGLGRIYALLAGMGAVSTYVVFRQLTDAENDIAVAGLFLVSIYYAIRHARTGRLGDLLLGAAAIGLLAGTKYYGVGYAFTAGVAVVFAAWLGRGPRAALRATAVGIAGAVLLGGYWYLRNTWVTGTPFYPKGYDAQTDAMARWRLSVWSSTLLGNGRPEVLPLLIDAIRRWGGRFYLLVFLAAPSAVCWLFFTGLWRKRYGDANGTATVRLTLVMALAAAAVVWGWIPFAVETKPMGSLNSLRTGYHPVRFGLSFLCLSAIGLALVLQDLGSCLAMGAGWIDRRLLKLKVELIIRAIGMAPLAAFGLAAGYQFFYQAPHAALAEFSVENLMVAAITGQIVAGAYLCWRNWPAQRPRLAGGAVICSLIAVAISAEYLADDWHAEFSKFYDRRFQVETFSRLAARDPAATNICALTYRYYPLFGSRRQFQVARPIYLADFSTLRNYLSDYNCTVVLAVLQDPYPNTRYGEGQFWIAQRPKLFVEIERNDVFLVCEIDRVRLDDAANDIQSPGP